MAVDAKYGEVEIPGVPDDEPVFILRGQDRATPQTIMEYANNAVTVGADAEHAERAREASSELRRWQEANPDRVKIPD